MNSRKNLIKKIKLQQEVEIIAKEEYEKLMPLFTDKKIINALIRIREEEIEHINDTQDMLNLLDNNKSKINVTKEIKDTKLIDKLKDVNSIFLYGSVDSYQNETNKIIKQLTKKHDFLYISYNKMAKFTQKVMEEHNIDTSKIKTISCVSGVSQDSISPQDLTTISIKLTTMTKNLKEPIVVIDAITSFLTFHPKSKIIKFVSVINSKATKGQFKIIWLGISEENTKEIIEDLKPICDFSKKI